MPRMDQAAPTSQLARLLLIGDGKIGKSYFAGMAGEYFNVLYFDGDVGAPTLSQLPDKVKRNIYLFRSPDTMLEGSKESTFIETLQEFFVRPNMVWNDSAGRVANRNDLKEEGTELWHLRPSRLSPNDVVVIDSWTALTESAMLQAAVANGVDLDDATMGEMRPVYQGGAAKATSILQVIRSLPCHCIVIAHPDEYQHKTAPEGRRVQDVRESDMVIDYTKMIPKSTSKPHGLQLPKYFTDIAWMSASPSGKERRLDFRINSGRVSGGHFDAEKSTEEYSFVNLVKKVGGTVPESLSTDAWLRIETVGPPTEEEKTKSLDATKKSGISGLAGLKKG